MSLSFKWTNWVVRNGEEILLDKDGCHQDVAELCGWLQDNWPQKAPLVWLVGLGNDPAAIFRPGKRAEHKAIWPPETLAEPYAVIAQTVKNFGFDCEVRQASGANCLWWLLVRKPAAASADP